MAKPPAGSSLLFGGLADSGHIKERKNGKLSMALEGVDEIDWIMATVLFVEGLARDPKAPSLFQVADIDTGVIQFINADQVEKVMMR